VGSIPTFGSILIPQKIATYQYGQRLLYIRFSVFKLKLLRAIATAHQDPDVTERPLFMVIATLSA